MVRYLRLLKIAAVGIGVKTTGRRQGLGGEGWEGRHSPRGRLLSSKSTVRVWRRCQRSNQKKVTLKKKVVVRGFSSLPLELTESQASIFFPSWFFFSPTRVQLFGQTPSCPDHERSPPGPYFGSGCSFSALPQATAQERLCCLKPIFLLQGSACGSDARPCGDSGLLSTPGQGTVAGAGHRARLGR